MAATKLSIYQGVARDLGERPINTITETNPIRSAIDDVYDKSLIFCLERGNWHFAARSVAKEAETAVEPSFGYSFVFNKPSDFVRTMSISGNSNFWPALEDYADELDQWHANIDPIYVSYVSDDTSFGLDLTKWPEHFELFVHAHIAQLITRSVGGSKSDQDDLKVEANKRLNEARSFDAVQQAPRRLPPGRWTSSRGNWTRGLARNRLTF